MCIFTDCMWLVISFAVVYAGLPCSSVAGGPTPQPYHDPAYSVVYIHQMCKVHVHVYILACMILWHRPLTCLKRDIHVHCVLNRWLVQSLKLMCLAKQLNYLQYLRMYILITQGASGVGLAAIQLCRTLFKNVTIITTAG